MISLIGIGDAGCNVVSHFEDHKEFTLKKTYNESFL